MISLVLVQHHKILVFSLCIFVTPFSEEPDYHPKNICLFNHFPVCSHSLATAVTATQLCIVALLTPFGLYTLCWAMVVFPLPLVRADIK